MSASRRGLLVLGNQLFPARLLAEHGMGPDSVMVFMCEHLDLCTDVRHHQQKIVLFFAAMREYAQRLRQRGYEVVYEQLDADSSESFEQRLAQFLDAHGLSALVHYEIEDHFFDRRIQSFADDADVSREVLQSPMFLTSRSDFQRFLDDSKPFMGSFYKYQRRRLGLLLEDDGSPRGGRWSFDEDNREPLPDDVEPPALPDSTWSDHTRDVVELVSEHFGDHFGDASEFWWPVTRRSALYWLRDFLQQRLQSFGPYEDALSQRSDTLFHSLLSPMLNLGLLTPREVLDAALEHAEDHSVPLNSLEGFVRQVAGWREFVRGIYHQFDEAQSNCNFWQHERGLTASWYKATTGIPPLDDAIDSARRLGWSHHIQRLMVVGNLMNLCQIRPQVVHDWFMETHVDSSDWVMGPNVYGMALFSDGGIFATKPYICGSNYLRKMGDYGKGPWCDVVDGLYWRFIDDHRDFFSANPRLSMMVGTLDRMGADRRQTIALAADNFLAENTTT